MPNSKSHSTDCPELPNETLPEPHISNKTYRIIGNNIKKKELNLPEGIILETIGDGKEYLDLKQYNIDPGSRVIINAHGRYSQGKHTILLEKKEKYTVYVMQNLSSAAKNSPINVEIFSCHGGYAINNIVDLPKHSSLMTFIDDNSMSSSVSSEFLQESSFSFRDSENQLMRFASYLLISPHITKFAIRGNNGNHFFFTDSSNRDDYTEAGIRIWQKELLKEYAAFLESIKEDMHLINKKHIKELRNLISHEVELNKFIESFNTKTYIGEYLAGKIINKDLIEVKNILEKGVEVNTFNNGSSVLYIACQNGHKDIVEMLLARGADINAKKNNGNTALYIACQKGHKDIVEMLLARGADINAKNNNGFTVLCIACQNGHKDIVEMLLARGADINAKSNNGYTVFHIACQNGHKDIVEMLLARGADINAKTNNGYTAFHIACQNGHKDIVEMLLARGADINAKTNNGYTALHIACYNGHKDIVEMLLARGADINAKIIDDYIALHIACQNGHKDIVEMLLARGADVNAKNNDDYTALHVACQNGHKDIVKKLIDAGADVNAKTKGGGTALYSASGKGNAEIVKVLIAAGAEVNALSFDCIPLHRAARMGHVNVIKELIKNGADVNALIEETEETKEEDIQGHSSLSLAVKYSNNIEAVKLLLAKGGAAGIDKSNKETIPEEIKIEIEKFKKNPLEYIAENNADPEERIKAIENYYISDGINKPDQFKEKLGIMWKKFESLSTKDNKMMEHLKNAMSITNKWNESDQKSVTPDLIKEYTRLNNVIKSYSAERVDSIRSRYIEPISKAR